MERPANMMPNGIPPQGVNMNTMQRPQPGNPHQQIYAQIMTDLRAKTASLPPGWQSTFDVGQRAQAIMQLVSALRLIDQRIASCIRVAETFEEQTIHESGSKEVYHQKLNAKLQEVKAKRMQKMQMQQGQMNMQMNNGMGLPQNNMGMGNGNMMQNNGMAGLGMGMGMNMNMNQGLNVPGGNEGQQTHGFPAQLQRPMQASPLPPQQNNQPSNGTLDPSALQNNQMPNFGQANQQPQQNMNLNANAQNQQMNPMQAQIQAVARQLMANTPEDKKNGLRQQFLNQLDDQKKQQVLSSGRDPLQTFFMMQATDMVRKRQAAHAGQTSLPQQGNGMQMGGVAMQQTASQSGGAPNFDFTSIIGQQASAIKSQESGEQVVPASNNGNGMSLGGGQMNLSQGVNPQAVTNQNGQGGNNPQLQQLLAAQQEKARQEQMRQQNQNAQNQAMLQQQAQQLRGQPGGLNAQNLFGNNGQVNSPAMNMNMLNRPMAPPGGQPAPSTPQQPRPGMAQTPVNNANQLAQHHQNMLNQNVQQGQGVQGMLSREQMINMMPPAAQDKLRALPPQQLDLVLARQFQNMVNRPTNGVPPPMGGMPGNAGSAVPQFNSQPNQNQNQQPPQQAPDQLQQRLQQHQNSQLRQRALDLMTFPRGVLPALSLSVPDSVNTWGKLKQHIQANHAVLPPNLLQKLQTQQQHHYEQHPDEVQQAMQNWARQMQLMRAAQQQGQLNQQQPQQGQPARPASSMAMPNGQAPQAQMVPPGMQPPAGQPVNPNANQQIRIPPIQPPTLAEIQAFRQSIPNAQNHTDDQIRAYIMQRKQQQTQHQIQVQQQAALKAQMQRAQALPSGQQQQGTTGQPPATAPQNQPPQAQRAQQSQPPGKQQNSQTQGQKRQQSDDVVEIPKPVQEGMPAANSSQQAQQGLPRMPTREEISKMTPEQQQAVAQKIRQIEALRKAQNPMQAQMQAQQQQPQQTPRAQAQAQAQQQPTQSAPNAELQTRLRTIYAEVASQNPKGPAVQLDPKSVEAAKTMLKKLLPAAQAITGTLSTAMRAPNFGERRVREAIRNLVLVQHNAANANGDIKDYLSLNLADLKQIEGFIGKYFSDMKALKEQVQAANGGQTQQQQQARSQPPAKAQEPPATKSNQAARKASAASTKAPPAPTDNKKFDWGSPSPHGVPKYEGGRTELTSDKLKLPANKKRKTNQADSQEAKSTQASVSAAASPKVEPKAQSQEQAPKMQPSQSMQKPPEPEKKMFKCDDVFCDASVNGFETLAQLKEHKEIEHKPIEDPLKFMLESAAEFLQVDQDGNPLSDKKDAKAGPASKPATKIATPAGKGKAPAKFSNDKPAETAAEKPQKEKTLYEVMCEKAGYDLPVKKEEPAPPSISIETENDDPFLTQLSNELSDFTDAFGDLKPGWLPSQADWDALPKGTYEPSPELTPSDQTSDSSHSSDVSTNDRLRLNLEWDPFGNGDTYVPEILRQRRLVSGQSLRAAEVTMQDADSQGKSGNEQEGEKKEDPWDWSDDLIDYDAFFENGNDKLFDASEAF